MGSKKAKKTAPCASITTVPVPVVVEKERDESSKDEIDAIFGEKKRKKTASAERDQAHTSSPAAAENGKSEMKVVSTNKKKKKKMKKTASTSLDPFEKNSELLPKSRKRTDDGLPVYNEEELGFNKKEAGGTPLCPFDCHCCF